MNRRPFLRVLTLVLATLQLASPGISAVVDAGIANAAANEPASHVEAASTEACAPAHSPECGACRYLSNAPGEPRGDTGRFLRDASVRPFSTAHGFALSAAVGLPRGRAPPAI